MVTPSPCINPQGLADLKEDILTSPDRHKTVLPTEILDYLNIKPKGIYLDVTFGCGGHTERILKADPTARVIALDWDQDVLDLYGKALKEQFGDRLTLVWGSFGNLYKLLLKAKINKVDGILADFGTSQFQIVQKDGFSFSRDTPLDMRMSPAHYYFNAADVVNRFKQDELADIFFMYSDERHSRKIAAAIVKDRKEKKFKTTRDLAGLLERLFPTKHVGKRKIHPATKVFQALRIFVNKELDHIETFLKIAPSYLAPGARLACISFHSLEDRIVKKFFRESCNTTFKVLTRKPISPTDEEIEENRSSRSAKLRVLERIRKA